MNVADIFASVRLNLETGQFEAQAAKATDKATATMGQHMKKAAGGILGAGVGAALVGAVQAGAEFEDQLRTINTVAKLTDEQLFAMGDQLQALSRETGKTTDDLTGGLYDLVSAGIPAGDAVEVLRSSAILATGALGTTGEAVDLVTSALGAWKKPATDATKVTDIFAQAVADGKTTVADLAGGISTVAPIAAAMGVSLEEVAAQTAVMTLSGDTASQAMTRIRNAMSALLTPNMTLNRIAERTGINFANLAKDKGLAIALGELRKATNGNNEEFGKALGSSEALTLAFAITGENAGLMATELDKVTKAGEEGGVALGQYNEKSKSGVEQGKRLSAWLKTLGQDFGGLGAAAAPVVMVLTSMGPMVSKAIGAGLGGLAGMLLPKIAAQLGLTLPAFLGMGTAQGAAAATAEVAAQTTGVVAGQAAVGTTAAPAAAAAGGTIGTAMGAAIPIALAAAAGIGIALAVKAIFLDPDLQQQSRDIGKAVGEQIATGATDQLEQSKAAIEQGITDINNLPLGGFLYGDQVRDLQRDLDAVNAEIAARATKGGETVGAAATQGVANGIETTTPTVEIAVADLVATFGTSMRGVLKAAKVTGADGMLAMAAGITAARAKPLDAFDTLKMMLKHALSPMGEIARLHGQLASKSLAAGLKSADPAVRAQAVAVAKAAADRLGELAGAGGKSGKAAMSELDKGIRSKIPAIREASKAAKDAAVAQLNATAGPAAVAGTAAAASFAKGLRQQLLAELLSPGKITQQGTYAHSEKGGYALPGRASGGPITSPSWVGEEGPEVYVPERAGRILSHEDSMAAVSGRGAGGGAGIVVNVYNPAPEPASTSTRRELRKLALSGSAA